MKNVTLCKDGTIACFPDAVTTRGQKHLRELADAVKQGYRAVIFFWFSGAKLRHFPPLTKSTRSMDAYYVRSHPPALKPGLQDHCIGNGQPGRGAVAGRFVAVNRRDSEAQTNNKGTELEW